MLLAGRSIGEQDAHLGIGRSSVYVLHLCEYVFLSGLHIRRPAVSNYQCRARGNQG